MGRIVSERLRRIITFYIVISSTEVACPLATSEAGHAIKM